MGSNLAPAYSDAEIDAIRGWLKEGLSSSQLTARFCRAFRPVTRNAIVGLVHRNKALKDVGFAGKARGGRRAPSAKPRSGVDQAKFGTERGAVAAVEATPPGPAGHPPREGEGGRQAVDGRFVFIRRTTQEMVDCVGAPLSPFAPPGGKSLADIESRECRFPIDARPADDEAATTFFCAAPVSRDVWMPGRSNGCYCGFHRRFLSSCARVNDDGDVMRRQPAVGLIGSAP